MQFHRQKLSRELRRHPCVASKTRRGPSILRRISYPPRSGIREHFIIRVTVASEQTRADNATPSRKCGSRGSETQSTRVGEPRLKGGQKQPLLPFAASCRSVLFRPPSARSPADVPVKSTPSTSLSSVSSSAEQKLVLALTRAVSFAHRVFRKWKGAREGLI